RRGEEVTQVAPHVAVVGVADQRGFVALTPGPERAPRQRDLHAQIRSTSTHASNAAWPPEKPKASTAASGTPVDPSARADASVPPGEAEGGAGGVGEDGRASRELVEAEPAVAHPHGAGR